MRYLSIIGFFPDEVPDDSLQFERYITDIDMNEKVAQLIESKPVSELEPGELLLSTNQVAALEALLKESFPRGLEYFMGTCFDY